MYIVTDSTTAKSVFLGDQNRQKSKKHRQEKFSRQSDNPSLTDAFPDDFSELLETTFPSHFARLEKLSFSWHCCATASKGSHSQ